MNTKKSFELKKVHLEQIRNCYQGLGKKTIIGSSGLFFYCCHRFRNPTIAPIFLTKKKLSTQNLADIEQHISDNPLNAKYDTNTAHISVIKDPYFGSDVKAVLKSSGWKNSTKSQGWINIWTEATKLEIPNGFYFKVGHFFEPSLHRDFCKMQRLNFGTDRKFDAEFDRWHRTLGKEIMLVVIYNSRNKPVGAGLVAKGGNQTSFLYSGSIDKRYRNKGLWKLLLAARQSLSNTGSGHLWVLFSRNPHISRKGQIVRKLHTFTKS